MGGCTRRGVVGPTSDTLDEFPFIGSFAGVPYPSIGVANLKAIGIDPECAFSDASNLVVQRNLLSASS
jgi:hypothetical protein